jgi:Zn-dependent oligopeptidase
MNNIQQLSNNIDQKLAQLDLQLARLQQQDSSEQILKDITALKRLKNKLQKSRNIMWQAHELQRDNDQQRLREKRLFGITLCILSALGLLGLLFIVLSQ